MHFIKSAVLSILFVIVLTLTTFADENDTATIENILPNAGDTSSSLDNFDLDGVQSGSSNVALTNNSTHNGFTITCDTQVSNACGKAFSGELEASHDMKVSASGTLVGLTGVDESNNSHTSNQKKLDGGIGLDSYFSVQNCEWSGSAHRCGDSAGSVDSYSLHIKIKNSSGDTLAEMTTTRTDDAGYYTNSQKFSDSLIYNGVGANSYEWYWKGIDGSESTTTITRGPNLLGAELNLAFPTDEYEVFTTAEIEELNEALGTTNLDESELWTGSLSQGMQVELTFEEEKIELQVYTPTATPIETVVKMETAIVELKETKAVETIKKQVIEEVTEELNEEPPTTQQASLPMVSKEEKISSTKEEKTIKTKTPAIIQTTETKKETVTNEKETKEEKKESKVKEEKKEVKQEKKEVSKKTTEVVEESNEEEETQEEKSTSETSTASVVSTKKEAEQKKIQQKKALVKNIDRVMDKIDREIKDLSKNLNIKNLIKLEAMVSEQASLVAYNKVEFYKPKDIYLDQVNIFDPRKIYSNVTLASYTKNDTLEIKTKKLNEIHYKKQKILMELKELNNG